MSDKDNQNHGFGGLGSLADEVPEKVSVEKTTGPDHTGSSTDSGDTTSSELDSHAASTDQAQRTSASDTSEPRGKDGSNAGWWFIAVIAVIAALTLLGEQRSSQTGSEQANNSSSSTASYSGSSADTHTTTPSRRTYESLRIDKPPAGSNRVLGVSQIRWCIREGIRIETLADWGNDYVDAHNRRVEDYNSRCAEFRYRVGNLSHARGEVAEYRAQIISELRRLYPESDATAKNTRPSVNKPSRRLVKSIQSQLNDKGFLAGPEDGLMGAKTAGAIRRFQQRAGLEVTGKPSQELLNLLRSKDSVSISKSRTSQEQEQEQEHNYATRFTRGSPSNDVLRLQGTPSSINTYSNHETWWYGLSQVKISLSDNRVLSWNHADDNLRVTLRPGSQTTGSSRFTRGSHADDVLRLQGTPSCVNPPGCSRISPEY